MARGASVTDIQAAEIRGYSENPAGEPGSQVALRGNTTEWAERKTRQG